MPALEVTAENMSCHNVHLYLKKNICSPRDHEL